MSYLLIRHEVEDFNRWKPLYSDHEKVRRAAGLEEVYLFRDAEQPSRVTLLFRAADVSKAKAFAASPELREKMKNAGVIGKPELSILNEA